MNNQRLDTHKKNIDLENYLNKLNNLLEKPEVEAIKDFSKPSYPVVFIVGCPRSGTTLLHQWLSNLGAFSYPTNLLSRFYNAPYIGSIVQQILTNPSLDYQGELFNLSREIDSYESNLGKTKGAIAPHGFHSFWRRFFQYSDIQYLTNQELEYFNKEFFLSELAAIESVMDKPLAMKALFLNLNIDYLYKIIPKTLFIYIRRNIKFNAQSLLGARKNYFGRFDTWYSYKPPEYEFLKTLEPYSQVAGQIYYLNKRIENQLKKMEENSWIEIDYSSFCSSPQNLFKQIAEKLRSQNCTIRNEYIGPEKFVESSSLWLSAEEVNNIEHAYNQFLLKDQNIE